MDQQDKFYPGCRVCGHGFYKHENLWIYKCEKCMYYTHVDCATSRKEPFMSTGRGKLIKNFQDADHPDLLHLPFPDQTHNMLKHMFFKEPGSRAFGIDDGKLKHISHQHPLILVDTTSSIVCHNPMKKNELLCNGCIRPIMTMPFYKCTNDGQSCNFVLHEWCTRLPVEVENHFGHPQHTLVLFSNLPNKIFKVFWCAICLLPCNGFVYGCVQCDYYIDVNCGFIPEKITHDAHANHLLSRVCRLPSKKSCNACLECIYENHLSFQCPTCDFNLHPECALLLPRTIRHKYDKHPMKLSYFPIENHKGEYFCEICEEKFDPNRCFYHCYECVQSMHPACAPSILQCETTARPYYFFKIVYKFINIKFGGVHNIEDHPHPLSFVQGIAKDGRCTRCMKKLQNKMIFKCLQCKHFAIDDRCWKKLSSS